MIKILKQSLKQSKFENTMEVLRIYMGIALFFKGIHFTVNPQDLVYWLNQGQLNVIETVISHYVISAHLVGGLLLTFGLLTRVAAAIQIPVLLGALGLVHSHESLFSITQNIELTSLVLFLLILYSIVGSGNISLDYHILNDSQNKNGEFIENIVKYIVNLPVKISSRQKSVSQVKPYAVKPKKKTSATSTRSTVRSTKKTVKKTTKRSTK